MLIPGCSGKNGNFYQKSVLFESGGGNDTIDCGDILATDYSANEVTISAWIRPSAIGSVMDAVAKAAVFGAAFNVIMGVSADGRLFGYFGDEAKTTQSASASQIAADTWYHVALTVRNISGTYTGNIWLNGVKQGSDVTAPGSATAAGTPFRIGSSYVLDAPDVARPFFGHICQVTVFNVGFTQAEVDELRQGSKPLAPRQHSRAAALVRYWPLGTADTYPTCREVVAGGNGTCQGMTSAANNFVAVVP